MEMATLPSFYGTKYTKILQRALQQDDSLMLPYVTVMPGCVGAMVDVPYIGTATMKPRTARHQEITQRSEMDMGSRKMKPRMFHEEIQFNNEDPLFNTNIDFKVTNILREVRSACNRTKDEVILGTKWSEADGCYRKMTVQASTNNPYSDNTAGGLLGTNYLGIQGDGLEDLADTDNGNDMTTNVVPFDFKYSGTKVGTGAILDKIVRGLELLKKRNSYRKGATTAVLALTSRQIAEIQLWESAQNKNYGFGNLVDGFRNTILGINIMETEMLPIVDLDGGKKARVCPLWVKEHAVYGTWQDTKVRIDAQLQSYVSTGQVVATLAMGASRKHKKSVIQLQCLETLAS